MKKNKQKGILIVGILMSICLIIVFLCMFKIYLNNKEYDEAQNDIKEIQEEYIDTTNDIIIDNENNEDNKNNESKQNNLKNEDENVINTNKNNNTLTLPNINLTALKKKNSDVIGWIYIPDTKINYPLLQGKTNETYIRTNMNGKYSIAGSIFLESKNNKYLFDANSIIFGHNMKNGDMFHDLRYFKQKSYRNSHNKIYIYIEDYILEYIISDSKIVNKKDKIYIPKTGNIEAQYLYENYDKTNKEERESILKEIYDKNQLVLSSCYSAHGDDRTIVISQLSNIYFP